MDRTRGIGGSDVGAILGVDRWKTAYDVWLEKMGHASPTEETPAIYWGRALEEPVARRFAEEFDVTLTTPNWTGNPRYDWLGGHADRLWTAQDGQQGVLEIKTAGAHMARYWADSGAEFDSPALAADYLPESAICQLAYYLAVFERPVGFICVLLGGRDWRYFKVLRDTAFEDDLLLRLDRWWTEHVVGRLAPPLQSAEDADRLYPSEEADSEALAPLDDVLTVVDSLRAVRERIKALTEERKALEVRVKGALGGAPAMLDHEGRVAVSWKSRTATRLDQRLLKELHPQAAADCSVESTFRVLRVNAPKKI